MPRVCRKAQGYSISGTVDSSMNEVFGTEGSKATNNCVFRSLLFEDVCGLYA